MTKRDKEKRKEALSHRQSIVAQVKGGALTLSDLLKSVGMSWPRIAEISPALAREFAVVRVVCIVGVAGVRIGYT